MRRIFFPLSKTAEPGPKKPHTFKMITPLPYRVRFFCAIQTSPIKCATAGVRFLRRFFYRAGTLFLNSAGRVRFFCAIQTVNTTPPALPLQPPYPRRFLPATLSAPPCPHLAIKKPPGQTPKRFIKIHVRLRLFAAGSGTVGKTGADTKIRISVALVF